MCADRARKDRFHSRVSRVLEECEEVERQKHYRLVYAGALTSSPGVQPSAYAHTVFIDILKD
jgi:hypothetical protein